MAPDDLENSISSEHNLIWIYCTYKLFTLLCFIFFPFSFCCCWCLCCWLLLVSHHLVFMYIYSSSIPIWNDSVHYSVVSTISFPVDSYQLQRLRKAGNKWTGGDGCTTIMLSITSTGRYIFFCCSSCFQHLSFKKREKVDKDEKYFRRWITLPSQTACEFVYSSCKWAQGSPEKEIKNKSSWRNKRKTDQVWPRVMCARNWIAWWMWLELNFTQLVPLNSNRFLHNE